MMEFASPAASARHQPDHAEPDSQTAMDNRSRIRAIVASSSGNLVEWYDFYAYAFTALYFKDAFFPGTD